MIPLHAVQILRSLTVRNLVFQDKLLLLVYAVNDRGCRILCSIFCDFWHCLVNLLYM